MLICFLLPCSTAFRLSLMQLLSSQYLAQDLVFIIGSKFLGNLFGIIFFKRIFSSFGALRTVVFCLSFLTQSILLLLFFHNIKFKIFFMFLLGFFELNISFIIKPIFHSLINVNYYRHLDLFTNNIVRFFSGLLLSLDTNLTEKIILSAMLWVIIIYVLSDARNRIQKESIKIHSTHLVEVFNSYPDYFWCSFLSNFCIASTFIFLGVFFKLESSIHAVSFLTFYIWGQFFFSYPIEILINHFSGKLYSIILCLFHTCLLLFRVWCFQNQGKYYFYSLDLLQILSTSLLGGAASLSHKYRFNYIFSQREHISINMTEDQIRCISSFCASIACYFITNIDSQIFWFIVIGINCINILQNCIWYFIEDD